MIGKEEELRRVRHCERSEPGLFFFAVDEAKERRSRFDGRWWCLMEVDDWRWSVPGADEVDEVDA